MRNKKCKDVTAFSLSKEAEMERSVYLSERPFESLNHGNDKTLASIELQIRKHHGSAIINLMNIGRELLEAKKRIVHGEFEDWVISLGLFSLRTAQKYMRLYEKLWLYPHLLLLIQNKGILELLANDAFPEELLKLLNKNLEGVYRPEEKDELIINSFIIFESNDVTDKVFQHILRNINNNNAKAHYIKDAHRIVSSLKKDIKYFENRPYSKYDNPLLVEDNKDSEDLCKVMITVIKDSISAIERIVNDFGPGDNINKFLGKHIKTMEEEIDEQERAINQNESDSAAEEIGLTKYLKPMMNNLSTEDFKNNESFEDQAVDNYNKAMLQELAIEDFIYRELDDEAERIYKNI